MDQYIYFIFVLKNYLRNIFGEHIPYEIIQIIIMLGYPKISVSCGKNHNFVMFDKKIYYFKRMIKFSLLDDNSLPRNYLNLVASKF